ncbi:hypothetical protein K0M31_003038 [Melipona bicolor]|uniref:Ecdysteroid UDP-glucosyltransferase n=1 Tax=Melipona bicolor TaxID=60889 RepID=A0AA40KQ41_9HYME|nr:hypothetical protein K0M31_003038 [Melipona bicolor]
MKISSTELTAVNEYIVGGLVLPSHESTWEMENHTGSNLPFLKRLWNFVTFWRFLHSFYTDMFAANQQLAEKYLGPLPPLIDIVKNTSMIFVNQAAITTPARPQLRNVISFTSFHIHDKLLPLPKDLQEFVDGAENGFIYFSLGSNAMSSALPMETQLVFCDVFATLPYRVVWKYEKDLPGKPDNVYTAEWLPQQSILARPNVKLFIYQGGRQSSDEAIHYGVPVLGFAILGDQDYQVGRMEVLGVGKRIDIRTVTKEELKSSIIELITNKDERSRLVDRICDPYERSAPSSLRYNIPTLVSTLRLGRHSVFDDRSIPDRFKCAQPNCKVNRLLAQANLFATKTEDELIERRV